MTVPTTTIHTRDQHDGGWDLATGRDVASGQVIGSVFWDHSDSPGWVLRFGEEDHCPDTTSEITALLAERGYELDASSFAEIERFDANQPEATR